MLQRFFMKEPVRFRLSSADIAVIAFLPLDLKYHSRKNKPMMQNMFDSNIYQNNSLVDFETLKKFWKTLKASFDVSLPEAH